VQEPTRLELLSAARAGGDYLVRMQKADGSFHYSYDPLEDRTSEQSYNILRHAGAVVSLFDIYAATGDTHYLDAARRAVAYLKTKFRRARDRRQLYVLDNDGKAKLGANGLALIALTRQMELDSKSSDRASAVKLAAMIIHLQRPDGSLASYYRITGDETSESVSLYYPGEAILGLVRLFKQTGDRRLLDRARRAADYLMVSQSRMNVLPPDAWLVQALEALHSIGRESRYAEHAIALAEAMTAGQYTEGEQAGGFGPGEPRSTPAASRAEGMVSAYRLARATGDTRTTRIADSLRASARFQLSQQFTSANDKSVKNPARALGGFRESMSVPRIRIDFVQHNVCSLLGIAEALY
jgi:uncharacterized protein YyaL (SSP411 family)